VTALPADARALSATLTVDLAAIRENYRLLARRAAVSLIPMVKADAYGLGAVEVARALEAERPVAFGVATLAEALELRAAGIVADIMVFTPMRPDEFAQARAAGLVLALDNPTDATSWAELGGRWHLAIDTGMARVGVDWRDDATVQAMAGVATRPEGVFTHFHSAEMEIGSVERQEERFATVLTHLDFRPRFVHAENSAALLRRGASRYDCARPGVALYGITVGPAIERPLPVATLQSRVVSVRSVTEGDTVSYGATWCADGPRRIATVALGYADGYPRGAGESRLALVNGSRVPVVGHVTMDMLMCDVTGVPVDVGDSVILIGADEELSVLALADRLARSPYEVLTGLRSRSRRTYLAADRGDARSAAA
jgi:alanine racemase